MIRVLVPAGKYFIDKSAAITYNRRVFKKGGYMAADKDYISVMVECGACNATGLCNGSLTKNGAFAVCHDCGGSGAVEMVVKKFAGRKPLKGVARVFKRLCGYEHDGHNTEGGCSYEEFLSGVDPKPVESLYCPLQWDTERLDNGAYRKLQEECFKHVICLDLISNCPNQPNKKACWKFFNAASRG